MRGSLLPIAVGCLTVIQWLRRVFSGSECRMPHDEVRRYGLIGAGRMGQEHIRSLAFVEGAHLVAIAEPNDRPMNQTFETLRNSPFKPAIYSEWREMIAAAQLDAVILATPSVEHHDMLVELMTRDFAIMVEGPLCSNLKQAQNIVNLAEMRQALTHVGLAYRYMPPVARFLERLHAGEAGTPRMLTIREHRGPSARLADAPVGGTFVEICSHFFDLMRAALKDEPVRIYASAGRDTPLPDETFDKIAPDILDNAMVIIDFSKGARAHLDLCMFAEGAEQREDISAFGEIGKLEVQVPAGVVTYSPRDASGVEREAVGVESEILAAGQHHGATVFHLRDFHHALTMGEPAPVQVQDGLRSIEMALAAQQSAVTGKAVTL